MIPPLIAQHAEKLKRSNPGLQIRELPDANVQAVLIEVPHVKLSDAWNRPTTTIRFLVPYAYPAAPPDSFWADAGLALRDGRQPQGSRVQPLPGYAEPLLWFSWHVQQWDPNSHTVSSFFEVIKNRFRMPQ